MSIALPLPIAGLIPHRPPMLLVDRLVELWAEGAVSETVFGQGQLFVRADGRVEEAALFEMMAQTFAAFAAAGREGPGPAAGFLVGLKRLTIHAPARAGSPVTVRVNILSAVEDFSVVAGEARQNSELLASGQLTVFVPEEA